MTGKQLSWRLLFIVSFLPLGLLVCLWSACIFAASAVTWILCGPDARGSQGRTERWLTSRTSDVLDWPLYQLMRKAEVWPEFWR
jgi:hypothetical protein